MGSAKSRLDTLSSLPEPTTTEYHTGRRAVARESYPDECAVTKKATRIVRNRRCVRDARLSQPMRLGESARGNRATSPKSRLRRQFRPSSPNEQIANSRRDYPSFAANE